MSSDADLKEAAVKGLISWTEDKIKELAIKFKDRKIAFIQDTDTINLVKEQLKSGEWDLCRTYLRDDKLKILVQMGLTLRKLDDQKKTDALRNLRDKIVKKHGQKGLHIAQFIQNKILTELIGSYVDSVSNVEDFINNIEDLLNNLEKHVLFVKAEDKVPALLNDIDIKITANVPDVFIIFARQSAYENGQKIKDALLSWTDLNYEIQIKEEKDKLLIFLFKEEDLS